MILEGFESNLPVLATMGVSGHTFMEAVSKRPDVRIIRVTQYNREGLRDGLVEMVESALRAGGWKCE
jgi:hypothetical protein